MIDIKDINGNVIQSVIITQNAERVIELMKADYVQLSWSSDEGTILPAGAYIEYKGEKFSLLEPYTPEQKDELEYEYKPQFQSNVMAWGKTPLFLYTQTESGVRKETDWVLTDNPANFMSYIADALYKELGEQWNYAVSSDLAASATISFSTSDIYSALNSIASAFETEWWVDKEGYTIHLGKCQHGNAIDLEVGVNVKTPSITRNKEGYFTRFYAFGSTRNIEQDYEGANANNIVNKRLTLDPTKYPQGYKDIREGLKAGEIFSKVLIFDDIYPSSKLSISNVRVRLLYSLDDDNNKVQVGTDSNGNPIYDQYAIWYFQIPNFTYDKENVIEGLVPSINFKTGALAGREFEIIYHDKDKEVTTTDGEPFKVLSGDYEICFIEEGTYIIPSVTGLTPTEGDEIVLFNIKMPEEYKQSAYDELEEALDKEIARMNSDLNTYQLQSDAVAFYNDNPNLTLGQKVRYTNGAYSFETRVMKLVTKLDYECEQAITIGNEKIKGNTEQLKEEVVNANTNINFLAALNETTNSLTQAYQRTQKMMMEGFASIKDMWLFDEKDKNTIYSKFNIYSLGYVSAKGANPNTGGNEGGATTLGGLRNVAADADRTYDVAKMLVLEAKSNLWTLKNLSELVGGLDEAELAEYLTKNNYAKKGDIPSLEGYATEQWVLGKGYLTEHQDLSAYAKKTDIPTIPTKISAFENDANYATTSDLDTRIDALVNGAPAAYDTLKEIADVLANNINSIDDILTVLGTKVSKDDFNTAIANVNNSISALNTELSGKIDLKLDAVTFNELFEKVQLEDGTWAIKAKLGLFSDGFISAKGSNVGGTSSEGGAVALYQLNDVLADGTQVSGAQNGAVFVYDATIGKWKGVAQSEIVPNLTGYATESWVLSQGFLTEHQDLSDYAKLSDIPAIPTTDINKGVTAYGWGDHSKVGYLTVITSKLVTDALGYTPYNEANFTKAKIKSTLGISDWALASSKPSYTTKEVSEDTNLYFTNARAVAALKSITDGLSGNISTLQGFFTDGVANSALKLSDNGSYTAWGQTFFANGKPKSVSGALTDVTTITTSGAATIGGTLSNQVSHLIYDSDKANRLSMAWVNGLSCIYSLKADNSGYNDLRLGVTGNTSSQLYFDASESKWGIGTSTPEYKLDVNGEARVTKLVIGNGSIEWDEANKGFKVTGLYSTTYLSAKGANTNGGSSSGGGLITSLYRYADLGKTFSDTNNDTFNAYTINKINADLGSRISVLEGKATNVSFTQSLTSGTQIGSISIDGVAKNIYAPTIPTSDINKGVTAYGWGNHASVGYAMASALGDYQTKITSSNKLDYSLISGVPTKLSQFTNDLGLGSFAYKSSLAFADLTNKPTTISGYGITDAYTKSQVDSALGGYLPKSGGTLTGALDTISAKYGYEGNYGLNMNNSDIIGANAIYFGDTSNSNQEGLHFIRSNGNYDTLRAMDGVLMFATNIAAAEQPTSNVYNTVYHTGNLTKSSIGLGNVDNTSDSNKNVNSSVRLRSMYGIDTSDNMQERPTTANLTFTDKSLRYFLATSSMTEGKPPIDSCILHLAWDNTALGRQIAVGLAGMYYRYQNEDTSWNEWKQIAFTDSNVASATKLQTSRTIWGQSFDGTMGVSGNLHLDNSKVYWLSDSDNFYIDCLYDGVRKTTMRIMGHYGHTFMTSSGDVVSITQTGNVLIGTTTDNGYKLDVSGILRASAANFGGGSGINIGMTYQDNTNGAYDLIERRASGSVLYMQYHHNGGINMCNGGGTVSMGGALDVKGTIHSTTGIFSDGYVSAKGQNTSSDMRLKNVLNEVVLGVKDIANAPSVRFSWKNGGGVDVGSSAQYWQGLLPDAVKERDGMLEMQYANIALLSAIALAKNFETMDERVARLEKENKELRTKIDMMERGIA